MQHIKEIEEEHNLVKVFVTYLTNYTVLRIAYHYIREGWTAYVQHTGGSSSTHRVTTCVQPLRSVQVLRASAETGLYVILIKFVAHIPRTDLRKGAIHD